MDEVNELPPGWKWVRLGDIFKLKSGDFLPSSETKEGGDYYVYGGNGITGKHNSFLFKEEKIVIGRVGANCGCVHLTYPKSWITDNALYISEKIIDFENKFMFFWLICLGLNKYSRSMAQPLISGQIILPIEIPLPPLPEQQRLATLLTDKLALIEQAKEKITAQLQAAQELTAAYLREVFESEEAKGWEWVELEDVCDIKGGKRLPSGTDFSKQKTDYPYIRVTDFLKGSVKTDNLKYIDNDTRKKISRYIIQKENVYISIAGSIGLVGTIPDVLHNANLTENAARLIIKNKSILNRDFLSTFLGSDLGQEKIRLRTNTVGQPKLALTRIATIEIPLPPPDKQKQLANYLTEKLATVEQLKATLQTQLDSINQLPAALLKQAFSGKI